MVYGFGRDCTVVGHLDAPHFTIGRFYVYVVGHFGTLGIGHTEQLLSTQAHIAGTPVDLCLEEVGVGTPVNIVEYVDTRRVGALSYLEGDDTRGIGRGVCSSSYTTVPSAEP